MSLLEGDRIGFAIEGRPGSSFFALVGELDLSTVGRFEDALHGFPADGDVVLDLSRLTFVDVFGLHALVRAGRHLAKEGRRLVVREPGPIIQRLIAILGEDLCSDLYFYPPKGEISLRDLDGTAYGDHARGRAS